MTAIVGQPLWHIASVHTGREVGFAGRLRLVALIDQLSVVQRILWHLGLPTDVRRDPRIGRVLQVHIDAAREGWRKSANDGLSRRLMGLPL